MDLSHPHIMGVINMSPNSFYRPSKSIDEAFQLARRMIAEGATILDIGGEATNPFVDIDADAPSIDKELSRLVPLVRLIREAFPEIDISIDTSTPEVMIACAEAGATMINDQRALRRDHALQTVVDLNLPVCLMHLPAAHRQPGDVSPHAFMQSMISDFNAWVERAITAGISPEHIILDPGFGTGNFGKNTPENFYLLQHLDQLVALGFPLLVGWSRKSMIGEVLGGVPTEDRLYGGLAAATLALQKGAKIIRTHDVKPTVDALTIVEHMRDEAWDNISEQTVFADA